MADMTDYELLLWYNSTNRRRYNKLIVSPILDDTGHWMVRTDIWSYGLLPRKICNSAQEAIDYIADVAIWGPISVVYTEVAELHL